MLGIGLADGPEELGLERHLEAVEDLVGALVADGLEQHLTRVTDAALDDVGARLRELAELLEHALHRRRRELADLRDLDGQLFDLRLAELAHDGGRGVGAQRDHEDGRLAQPGQGVESRRHLSSPPSCA